MGGGGAIHMWVYAWVEDWVGAGSHVVVCVVGVGLMLFTCGCMHGWGGVGAFHMWVYV